MSEIEEKRRFLVSKLRQFPDFPSPGILFEDIMPIFADPIAFNTLLDVMADHLQKTHDKIDVIVGLESRGFLFGPSLALRLNCAFAPVRKAGKLPGETVKAEYQKEYGTDVFEMQKGILPAKSKIVVVDDIIATGGSAKAAGDLIAQLGCEVLEYLFLMELSFLKGRDKLSSPVYTILAGQE
ncbi:hypothetical protein CANCADRAFT_1222 [Tortispora caseinolytica NRRL Y-17796]|uniref:adenine phosphoribosyltransferase n=1 Tax=Tortispora caseinolytica NRRL Y-17796 TaxID=767744 RepID=A0A1E4TLJ2_9ASCO|nr:hypothetical protein CANCADRAFT_1222 [Tortispora caseinolytica NRRL Y-17796]